VKGNDTKSSYIILSIFFSCFLLVLIKIRGVLAKLPIIFGTFCNVFYLSRIIILFPKHINYRVLWCNLRRNHANRHSKIFEDFGKTMNEDSRGLERHYKGRNYVPKSQDILYGRKHPKRQRNNWFCAENCPKAPQMCCHAPQVSVMRPKCVVTLEAHENCTSAHSKAL